MSRIFVIMLKVFLVWLAVFFPPLSAKAQFSEALKFLTAESDLIIVATVTEPPTMWGGSAPIPSEKPVAYWIDPTVRVNVVATIKGVADSDSPLITARIPAVADAREHDNVFESMTRMYARDRKCILFLQDRRKNAAIGDKTSQNGEAVHFVAFDPFFSCQSYDRAMEIKLRELMARKE